MADVAPDLTASLLAAFSSAGEEKSEPFEAARELETAQPTSPAKRSRPDEPEERESTEKRQKTEHESSGNISSAAAAGSWDISAMIQNALGSLDDPLNESATARDDDSVDRESATPILQQLQQLQQSKPQPRISPRPRSQSAPARKIEQKRMKFSSNPYYVMRTMSLPLLGSLAVQILIALSQQPQEETQRLLNEHESEYRKAYDVLRNTFGRAKEIFSDTSPLLFADELEVSDSEDRETLRVSNLATISSSVYEGRDDFLSDCDQNFAAVFEPEDGDLPENSAKLHVSIKTQAFIRSLNRHEGSETSLENLNKFFPSIADEPMDQPQDESPHSAEERAKFTSELRVRRQALLESIMDHDTKRKAEDGSTISNDVKETATRLSERYPFEDLLRDLSTYLQTQLSTVIDYAEKYGINIPLSEELAPCDVLESAETAEPEEHDELSLLLQNATSGLIPSGAAEEPKSEEPPTDAQEASASLTDSLGLGKLIQDSLLGQDVPAGEESMNIPTAGGAGTFESRGLASLIASKLSNGFTNASNGAHGVPTTQGYHHPSTINGIPSASLAQLNQLSQTPYYSYTQTPAPPPQVHTEKGALPPNQTHPTSILYERARQAAVAKSSSTARREGLHSTRRAWTPEEEKALMAGLDMVKGPHWSQILTLFGQNGTVSDILKDRTQVQLKDKARNLKLFFLKTNSEMPYYLQCVTGELKTRAPSQAARKEAEEKARLNSEEEHARLQGLATLSAGVHSNFKHPGAQYPTSTTSAPTRASPVTSSIGTSGPALPATSLSPARHSPFIPTATAHIKSEPPDSSATATATATSAAAAAVAAATASYPPRVERPVQPTAPRPENEQQNQPNQPNGSALQRPEAQATSLSRTQEPRPEPQQAQPTAPRPFQNAAQQLQQPRPPSSTAPSGIGTAPSEAPAPIAKNTEKPAQPRDSSDLPHLEALRALQASLAASSS